MDGSTKKCSMCAETIPLEAEVCEYCGAQYSLTLTGYCIACHAIREADSGGRCKVCKSEITDRHMESKLAAEGGPAPSPTPPSTGRISTTAQPSQPAGKKSSSWLLSLGGAAFAAVCCTIFGLFVGASGGGEILKTFNPFAVPTATPSLEPSPTASNTPQPVQIRWLVGIAAGTDPAGNDLHMETLVDQAVADFNVSHPGIILSVEKVPSDAFFNTLSAEMAAGNGPDIAGPMGIGGAISFHGQWLDIAPYIESTHYDTSAFSPALVAFHNTEEGQLSLPFEVYPAAIFYQKELFDRAGLHYPPAGYGEWYTWPDGNTSEWNFDTLTEVAKLLTIDSNGKNATEKGFHHDQNNIYQFGFINQWSDPIHTAGFWGSGKPYDGEPGKYTAAIPIQWKAAWRWYYEGMWGPQTFIPSYASPIMENAFATGRVAMAITHTWYACCIGEAGTHWDLATLPSYNGVVHGVIHADSFYILKNTKHPGEAFNVLTYLVSPEMQNRLIIYFAMPAATANQAGFFSRMDDYFPWATNWKVFQAGLNYLDIPSVEGYWPNNAEARSRVSEFDNLMGSDGSLDIDTEIGKLEDDLQIIFNK